MGSLTVAGDPCLDCGGSGRRRVVEHTPWPPGGRYVHHVKCERCRGRGVLHVA